MQKSNDLHHSDVPHSNLHASLSPSNSFPSKGYLSLQKNPKLSSFGLLIIEDPYKLVLAIWLVVLSSLKVTQKPRVLG